MSHLVCAEAAVAKPPASNSPANARTNFVISPSMQTETGLAVVLAFMTEHGAIGSPVARPAKGAISARRFDALGLERGGRGRRAEKFDQRLGRLRLLGGRAQAGGKADFGLQCLRDRA